MASKQLTKYQTHFPKRSNREQICHEVPFCRNAGGGTNGDAPRENTSLKIRDRISAAAQGPHDCQTKVDPVSTHVSNKPNIGTCKFLSTKTEKNDNNGSKTFIACNIKNFIDHWRTLTSDHTILTAVSGYKIDFLIRPTQIRVPRPFKCSIMEASNITSQITIFLEKGITIESSHEPDQFVSTVFLREKKDGTFRMILNLKELNRWVTYDHFKMDSILTCIQLIKPYCYMCSIDIKDAYYSISIHSDHQKHLKFSWGNKLYQFTSLAQGFAYAPCLFTKLMKPVFAFLRKRGHLSSGYQDHSVLVA